MSTSRILKNLQETSSVFTDLLLRRYPKFVYGGQLSSNEIPIFVFHSVEPAEFEKLLQFLSCNGYKTLTSEDVIELHRAGEKRIPGRSILLTFDDGMKSVWSFAYPLLKRYGFRATTFLIPDRIPESNGCSPNLEDIWAERAALSDIRISSSQYAHEDLASWQEIQVMHSSGVIDFQSHTNGHELIFTKPEIQGFLSPQLINRYHPFEFPRKYMDLSESGKLPFGAPLHVTAPRMSDELRYIEDDRLTKHCVDYVAERDAQFFERPDWDKTLMAVVSDYRKAHPSEDSYETPENQEEAIVRDLRDSKAAIEDRLPGKTVRSLCFPWGIAGSLAGATAISLGFEALYWGKVDGKLIYRVDDNPLTISRIGEDFVHLLPGDGRQNLAHLVAKKLKRRLQRGSPFYSH